MKLLVTRRDGHTETLELKTPLEVHFNPDDIAFKMYYMRDANGTDHYFNKNDGTYDGWGRGVSCNEEGEELFRAAAKNEHPPTPKIN